MKEVYTHCSLCRASIHFGEDYGTMVFNKECINKDREGNYSVTVVDSVVVHTMCIRCSDKMDMNGMRGLLD